MKARGFVFVFSGLLLSLSGCVHRIPLVLDKEKPVEVYALATHSKRALRPGTDAHQKLADWLATNQSGWDRYLATPPGDGLIVEIPGNRRLQFLNQTVLLSDSDGIWMKQITPDDYSFLKP